MATIDEDIEEKKLDIKKAEIRYQEALRSGEGAAQAGLELETLRNDLNTLEKQKNNPQPQKQPKERKPSKLEQAAKASQSSRQLGNEANANQIIQKHLDSSTYFGETSKKPRTREDILRDLNEARAKGDVEKIKELEAELRGSPINVNAATGENEGAKPTAAPENQPSVQATQSTATQQAQTNTQNTTPQQTPTPDAMAGHYSRDPNQATKQPKEEKKDEKTKPKEKKRWNFSPEFFGDLFKNRNPNNVLYDRRDMMRNLADEATNESATHGMEAQGWQQIANRNPYSEASKYASATNAQQMAANIAANSATGNNQVGLVRMNNPMDINAQDQKAMEARLRAETPRQKQLNAQGQSTAYLGEAQQLNTQAQELAADRAESRRLSLGEGGGVSVTTEKEEPKPKEETPVEETPETPTEENQPEPQQPVNYNAQHIINALLGSSKGQDLRNGTGDENDLKMYNWVISQGVEPITPVSKDPNAWENEFISKYGDKGKEIIKILREGRSPDNAERNFAPSERDQMNTQTTMPTYACGTKNAKKGYAIVGENGPEIVKMKGGEEVIPNEWAERIISDERMKFIKTCFDMGLGISPEDFEWLAKKQGGKFNFNDREYDFFNDDDWTDDTDDSVLNGYANHIKNYLYTYIPEAQEIDESIDPNQEHIGPMAQDIEKVNPACIVETPEGVKTVDTGRLAMMNAGAIGDLARQLRELKEVFING